MGCLTIEQIYLFLEGELSPQEVQTIHAHLESCPRCRKAIDARRSLVQAVDSLPRFKVPPDFTQQVMARIFPEKAPLRAWIKAIAGGLSSMVFAFFLYYIFSGKNLAEVFVSLNQFFLSAFRTLSTGFVKAFKLIWHLIDLVMQFFSFLLKGFSQLTTIVRPEVQVAVIALILLVSALLFIGVRRKLMMGEKV